jgi:hypothetical protein
VSRRALALYAFWYGCLSSAAAVVVYVGVALGHWSVIPDRAEPALVVFAVHFVPYYLMPSSVSRQARPILRGSRGVILLARGTSVAVAIGLLLHVALVYVAVRIDGSLLDPVVAVSLNLVWIFLATGVAMIWVYGLGIDTYLPEWVRRWRQFSLGGRR